MYQHRPIREAGNKTENRNELLQISLIDIEAIRSEPARLFLPATKKGIS